MENDSSAPNVTSPKHCTACGARLVSYGQDNYCTVCGARIRSPSSTPSLEEPSFQESNAMVLGLQTMESMNTHTTNGEDVVMREANQESRTPEDQASNIGTEDQETTLSVETRANMTTINIKCACGKDSQALVQGKNIKCYYKLPEENGGCGFFEWCGKNGGTNSPGFRSQSHALNPSFPDLSCPCGAGYCLILTGKSIGQAFYKCPANQGSSCGFFKWCHDQTTTNSSPASVNTSVVPKATEMGNKNYATKGSSPCYKCGQDGHWAKDCTARPPIQNPAVRARSHYA